jgi:serine/threonine protein kinase/tetratricopeptide (TPR) repeat protein
MSPERLHQIENLFHLALEQAPPERLSYLKQHCGDDENLLQAVEALLTAESSHGRLKELVASTAVLAAPISLLGRRVGAYEILSEIGQGGMGAVYLATRVDEAYSKKVAIKFVKAGWTSEFIHERFRAERQILANLNHPYIAGLLDGGTAFDGRPYLVMEYVDGLLITEFLKHNQLDTQSLIQLFRRICEAVEYAHQNLVVHRDLKPANIMITAEGVPKLLDFGIAKLLDVDEGSSTTQAHGWRMLTPEYASPEQFRGDRVTTATDIYSLGAILYVLLAGKGPYALHGKTPTETERIVSEEEPPRPSLGNPALRGSLGRDLDTIVLKAMRKSPWERYGSVGDLSMDLARALSGQPVQARNYTFVERGARLVRQHRLSFVAGALIAASMAGGTAVSVHSAREAERQRARAEVERARAGESAEAARREQERAEKNGADAEFRRQEADVERGRAEASLAISERRLDDEHRLTTEVLVDINDSLQTLPGATAVRTQAVQASAKYLDRLVNESQGNSRLQQDLAIAYVRMADLTGNPAKPNQGDLAGALSLYQRAKAVLQRLLLHKTGDPALRQQLAAVYAGEVGVLSYLGRVREAQEEGERAVVLFRGLVQQSPNNASALFDLANCYISILQVSDRFHNREQVIHYAGLARKAFELLTAINPRAIEPRVGLSDALAQESSAQLFLRGLDAALPPAEASLRIREQLRAEHPDNRMILEGLMFSYGRLGDISNRRRGEAGYRSALEYFGKAREVAALLARQDPANQRAQFDLAVCGNRLGEAFANLDEHQQATAAFGESLQAFEKLTISDSKNTMSQMYAAVNSSRMGYHMARLGRRTEALEAYTRAIQISQPLVTAGDMQGATTGAYVNAKIGLALDAAERGDRIAEQWTNEALVAVEKLLMTAPTQPSAIVRPSIAFAGAGQVYEALAGSARTGEQREIDIRKALDYYRRAARSWERLPEVGRARSGKLDADAIGHAQRSVTRLAEHP